MFQAKRAGFFLRLWLTQVKIYCIITLHLQQPEMLCALHDFSENVPIFGSNAVLSGFAIMVHTILKWEV